MNEPSGADLARTLRSTLPSEFSSAFDDGVESLAVGGDLTPCGALMALGWVFRDLVEQGREPAIKAVLDLVEDLLVRFAPGPGEPISDGTVYNSVLACFLEDVLPVRADKFGLVTPHIGPAIRRWAAEHEAWWLLPEPDV